MDEDTVTIGGPRHSALVYKDRWTKNGKGECWVCESESDDAYGYGSTSGEAIAMYLKSREKRTGIPRNALTVFRHAWTVEGADAIA